MAFFDKFKSAIGLEDDYDEEWLDDEDYEDDYDYDEEDYVDYEDTSSNAALNLPQNAHIKMEMTIHRPLKYEDGTKVLTDVKDGKIVLINFEEIEEDSEKKRLFEFVNGGIYSLEAAIVQVSVDNFAIAPRGVEILDDAPLFGGPSSY